MAKLFTRWQLEKLAEKTETEEMIHQRAYLENPPKDSNTYIIKEIMDKTQALLKPLLEQAYKWDCEQRAKVER